MNGGPAFAIDSLLTAALQYAQRGWHVFPCKPRGKAPRTKHGFKDATTEAAKIRQWWGGEPDANVAVATGAASGIVVIDVDAHDGIDGEASLTELTKRFGPLPKTIEQQTGGGGRQLFFRHPGVRVPNATALHGCRGVDVRGDGGYAIVPPSIHPTGIQYAWEPSGDPPEGVELAELPKAWIQALTSLIMRPKKVDLTANGPVGTDRRMLIGTRNTELFRRGCALRAKHAGPKAILAELRSINQKEGDPPVDDSEVIKIAASCARYEPAQYLTELWAAERFVERHGRDFRYSATHGWLVYDGHRWVRDETLVVPSRCAQFVRGLYADAAGVNDDVKRKQLVDFARGLERSGKISAIIELSRMLVPVTASQFDADPWLFNVMNGTLDLRSGELRGHRREDYITKLSSVPYLPTASAPAYERFVRDIFGGDESMVAYANCKLGSCLTGIIRDHELAVWWGGGQNGKTTLAETWLHMMGDYGMPAAPGLLIERHNDAHPTERAELRGVRLVVSAESKESARLDEEKVKLLTGGDRLKGRFMRMDFFSFEPTHKLVLFTNHKPTIRGTDTGIWRRVRLWPFEQEWKRPHEAGPDDRVADLRLPEKLRLEASGILALAVRGCLEWQGAGLNPPDRVQAATRTYRADSDLIGRFLRESCIEGGENTVVGCTDLYRAYVKWAELAGMHPVNQMRFGVAMSERGFSEGNGRKKPHPTRRTLQYLGIGLLEVHASSETPKHTKGFF